MRVEEVVRAPAVAFEEFTPSACEGSGDQSGEFGACVLKRLPELLL
jgi:hypothetical protein